MAATKETPMLYVFSNRNGVQIAWNYEAPRAFKDEVKNAPKKRGSMMDFVRGWTIG